MARASRPVVSLLGEGDVDSFKSLDNTVCVAYVTENDQNVKTNFRTLATHYYDQFTFGIVEAVLPTSYGTESGCIVCYTSEGLEERVVLCGQTTLNSMESFLNTATSPLVGGLTRRSEMKYSKVC